MAPSAEALQELSRHLASGDIREPIGTDAIDGSVPQRIVEPSTAEGVAAALAWCSTNRQSVVIRGGGTKLGWGRRPGSVDVLLSTTKLAGVLRYEPGDLTVTAAAGTSLEDLNQHLSSHGQWLPIDARGPTATVGGAVATNECGPLRHRYGTPRDQLIGVRLATADGRLASAGGNVVKNVAGYDLGKLIAGSFGSLAAIVSATFKLAPVPAISTTLVASFKNREDLSGAAAEISSSQLDPMSVEIEATGPEAGGGRRNALHLLIRFAGTDAGVDEQLATAERLAAAFHPAESERMAGDADQALWSHRGRRMWGTPGTIVKASWMPASLGDVISLVDEVRGATGAEVELVGRAALGTGLIRIAGEASAEIAGVEQLRARPKIVGHVVVVRSSPELKSRVDVWNVSPGTAAVTRLLKQALDPAGILNAQRGPA